MEPNRSGGEVDGGKEVSAGFVIAGCDRPELLEFGEEILDQVALFVEFSIEFARRQAVWSRRDYGGFCQPPPTRRGLGYRHRRRDLRSAICGSAHQPRPSRAPVPASARSAADYPTQRVDQRMDLVLRPPLLGPQLFLRAPARC